MKLKVILYIALCFFTITTFAQKQQLAAADKLYEQFAYVDAIKIYEKAAQKDNKSETLLQKLGNSYYFNAQLDKANKWYDVLFENYPEQSTEYLERYAQTLKSVGQIDKSNTMMTKFSQKASNDGRAKLYVENRNYLEEINANSGNFSVEEVGINSEFSDFGATIYNNSLVFSSTRQKDYTYNSKSNWTNQAYTNLYISEISANAYPTPKIFSKDFKSKYNQSTPVFTKDGSTMYYTVNNFDKGKKGKDNENAVRLKLYRASIKNGEWTNSTELPFNSNEYSTAHPALSPDESTLYFASDMPGTQGQSDLYKVAINGDGTFGSPKNLGPTINTPGKETFPFVTDENEIYFATDGHPGLGGLDIFVSKITDNKFSEPVNIGAPVNGKTDDFGFIINTKTNDGYFSSNRAGGKGFDDIYKLKKTVCSQELIASIVDADTGSLLTNTDVVILDNNANEVAKFNTSSSAKFNFNVKCGATYVLKLNKENYIAADKKVTISKTTGKTNLSIPLSKKPAEVIKVGADLAKILNLKMIFFDSNKSIIRPDAALELSKIYQYMEKNPSVKIDIRSHTDSRGGAKPNEILSDKRAKASLAWLVAKGVEASRLSAKGYGESILINKCSDNVPCTPEEHQVNRRSEFIVVSM